MGATRRFRDELPVWMLKAYVQRLLARAPDRLADGIYHGLQHAKGLRPNAPRNIKFVEELVRRASEVRGPIRDLTVVEVGSGWFPTTPLVLAAGGYARTVHTYDLNEHYAPKRIRAAAETLRGHFPEQQFLETVARTGVLPPSISYHPHTNVARAGLADASVDLAITEFVLEHVEPGALAEIHRESRRWLRPDGLWVHWVSPSDHRSYGDRSLHPVDFLRYSEDEWDRIAGNRFAYHNRLRKSQFRRIFQDTGWEIVAESASVPDRTLATLPNVRLHADYADFAPEDLVAGSLWFVLRQA